MRRLSVHSSGLLIVLLALPVTLLAGSYKLPSRHLVSIDAAVGYQALLTDFEPMHAGAGTGFRLGVGYQLESGNFLLRLGLEGRYASMRCRLDDMRDTLPEPFGGLTSDRVYLLNQHRDTYRELGLSLPILMGANIGKMYVLAGVKPSISVWGTMEAEAHLNSWLDYYGPIDGTAEDRLLQSFDGESLPVRWRPQVYVHAELGRWVIRPRKRGVRPSPVNFGWALWADYGVLNAYRRPAEAMDEPVLMGDRLAIAPTLQRVSTKSHPLAVGVRMTLLLDPAFVKHCHTCKYYRQ